MNPKHVRRVRDYIYAVDVAMNQIPHPVPPRPPEEWDGPLLDARPVHLAYSRLPEEVQAIAAPGYAMCREVFDHQLMSADGAYKVRYKVFSEILHGTGLSEEQLVPDADMDPYLSLVRDEDAEDTDVMMDGADDLDDDDTDGPLATVIPLITPPTDDDSSNAATGASRAHRRLFRHAAAASLVAAGCIATLAWQHISPAPAAAQAFTINRVAQADELTLIVSHGERVDDTTRLHVYVTNSSTEPQTATLTLGQDDADPPPMPTIVPPKSTQHSVLEVRKRRTGKQPVEIELIGAGKLTIEEL